LAFSHSDLNLMKKQRPPSGT